jgi:hypothetical protein
MLDKNLLREAATSSTSVRLRTVSQVPGDRKARINRQAQQHNRMLHQARCRNMRTVLKNESRVKKICTRAFPAAEVRASMPSSRKIFLLHNVLFNVLRRP